MAYKTTKPFLDLDCKISVPGTRTWTATYQNTWHAAYLGGDEVALGQVRLEVDDAVALRQAACHARFRLGEHRVAGGLL